MKTKYPFNKQAKWVGIFFLLFISGAIVWTFYLLNNYYLNLQ